MKLIAALCSVVLLNCAYGDPIPETKTYGHHNPADDSFYADGGRYNSSDPGSLVPYGCSSEEINEGNGRIDFFVFCPDNPMMAYKWLVDPPPDKQ